MSIASRKTTISINIIIETIKVILCASAQERKLA